MAASGGINSAIMTNLRFQFPEYLSKIPESKLGVHLAVALQHAHFPGITADIVITASSANPDLFYVYVVPRTPLKALAPNYHYFSPHLPALSREMFDDLGRFGEFLDVRLALFRDAINGGDLKQLRGVPPQERDDAIAAMDREVAALS